MIDFETEVSGNKKKSEHPSGHEVHAKAKGMVDQAVKMLEDAGHDGHGIISAHLGQKNAEDEVEDEAPDEKGPIEKNYGSEGGEVKDPIHSEDKAQRMSLVAALMRSKKAKMNA